MKLRFAPTLVLLLGNTNIGSVSARSLRSSSSGLNGNDVAKPERRNLQEGDEAMSFLKGLAADQERSEEVVNNSTASSSRVVNATASIEANADVYEIVQGEELKVDKPGFLENDFASSESDIFVASSTLVGDFRGELKIDKKGNGKFRYSAREDTNFVGTDVFQYTACLEDEPAVCDSATVTVNVLRDPDRPTANPIARDDAYTVREGQTLAMLANGFLANDQASSPTNPFLVRCSRGGSPRGDLDTHSDGSFEYTAPRCWTGQDSFEYTACYEDYEDMESDTAFVRIQVQQDRPNPPVVRQERYQVREGESLDDIEPVGHLLRSDEDLYVKTFHKSSGFEGDLDVDLGDGEFRFDYKPEAGKRGTYRFEYTVCNQKWEACVSCSSATVDIDVTTNPNKPNTPPSQSTNPTAYGVPIGQVLEGNVLETVDNKDSRYNLVAKDIEPTAGGFGVLDTIDEDEGSFQYGNAPAGTTDTITFQACYKEWPDLCSDGSITIATTGSTTSGTTESESLQRSQEGVAAYYDVNWVGGAGTGCQAAQPKVSLSCSDADLEISLISAGIRSNNDGCQKTKTPDAGGVVVCLPQTLGAVQVECRDPTGSNDGNHQLIVNMTSEEVSCQGAQQQTSSSTGSSVSVELASTHHYGWIRTWCNGAWMDDSSIDCGKDALAISGDNGEPDLCYSNAVTLGASAKPADVTMMTPVGDSKQCIVGTGAIVPLSHGPPQLQIIGDADGDLTAEGYPLKECQADCDEDSECSGGLVCFESRGNEVVPGCVGTAPAGQDFCIHPNQQAATVSRVGSP